MSRVAVLMGGTSSEREISLASGAQVLAALPQAEAVVIEVDGRWRLGEAAPVPLGEALSALPARFDVAFLALHGPFGEDGTVQALLDAVGLPYTGSGVMASSLAMDKARSKMIYRAAGLPTAASEHLTPEAFAAEPEGWLARIEGELGLPVVVKPACDGSSYGVRFSQDRAQLAAALTAAEGLQLVEPVLSGREFTCAVLDRADGPQPLPITEIIPGDAYDFFDTVAKYTPGATREITPADLPPALAEAVQALAVRAHQALGCRDMSRTDFIYDGQQAYLLETNTIPGLTATSLLPQAAAAAGLSFSELVQGLVDRAAARA